MIVCGLGGRLRRAFCEGSATWNGCSLGVGRTLSDAHPGRGRLFAVECANETLTWTLKVIFSDVCATCVDATASHRLDRHCISFAYSCAHRRRLGVCAIGAGAGAGASDGYLSSRLLPLPCPQLP